MKGNNKSLGKKILSWLLITCLLLGMIGIIPQQVQATDSAEKATLPTGYTEVTPRDFGVADGVVANTTDQSKIPTTSFDKVMLNMNLKINTAGKGVTLFKTRAVGEGLKFWLTNGHTLYMSNWCHSSSGITMQTEDGTTRSAIEFSPSVVFPADSGIVWFDDAEFNLTVTIEAVTRDDSGENNDLKIGVWFNGVLYDNQYYYLMNIDPDTNPLQPAFRVDGGSAVTIHSPFVNKQSKMPEGYTVITPHTFGIADQSSTEKFSVQTANPTSAYVTKYDKHLYAANVTVCECMCWSYIDLFRNDYTSSGLRFALPGSTNAYMTFYNYLNKESMYVGDKFEPGVSDLTDYTAYALHSGHNIYPSQANIGTATNFRNINMEIWITMDVVDIDGDGLDDMELGVYINGERYDNKYFYIPNCSKYSQREEVKLTNVAAISSPRIDLTSFGTAAGVYAATTRENHTSDLVKDSKLNKVTFEAPILFNRAGGTFYYGGTEQAVMLTSTEEGLVLKHNIGGVETQLDVLNAKNVGVDTVNRALDVKLSTEIINTDDILLGVNINGKYRSYEIVDAASSMKAYIGLQTENGATIALGEQANETPTSVTYCLTYGNYVKEKLTSMERLSVNGVASDTDIRIDGCGVYSIAYTQKGKIYMEEVLTYYQGDVTSDNQVNVIDLVRMLKVADTTLHDETIAKLDEAGKKAIGYTEASKWNDTAAKAALKDIKNLLVGTESTYTEYTNFENGYLYNGGEINDHLTYTLRTADYISIDDFIDISVDEPCQITWYGYRRDFRTFSSTDYVSGYTKTKVTSITKEEILAAAPPVAYVKFVIEPEDTTKMDPTLLSAYGLTLHVRNIPGTRVSSMTAVNEKQLMQFADGDGVYTKDFTVTLNKADMSFLEDIWILGSEARYETATGAQPTIQYELVNSATGEVLYYAFPYVIGGEGTFEQQEWRIPGLDPSKNSECQDMGLEASPYDTVRIDFVIPEGVKLYVNNLTNKANYIGSTETNNGVKYISHTGMYNYAPTNTILAFEMAGQMGYESMVTIVKFTKDGIPICFHDDENIRFLLTYKDGSDIPNDNGSTSTVPVEERVDVPISNYTYAELIDKFSAGYKKDPIYKNLNVPKLEDYFKICVKYKMEPQFSVHPSLTEAQWLQVKQMMVEQSTDEWNLLEHFFVKTGDLNELKKTQQIFGKSIGGYIIIVPNNASVDYGLYSIAQRAGFVKENNSDEVDFDGYNLSVAFFQQSKTVEEGVEAAIAAGFKRIDMYGFWGLSGQEFTKWMEMGVMHYCLDYHTSPRLNW